MRQAALYALAVGALVAFWAIMLLPQWWPALSIVPIALLAFVSVRSIRYHLKRK